jgi:hypothetical protein
MVLGFLMFNLTNLILKLLLELKLKNKLAKITNRTTLNVFLVASIFIWYYIAFKFIQTGQSGDNLLLIIGSNAGAVAASALIASVSLKNFKNTDLFFNLWISAGVLISLIPLILNTPDFNSMLFFAVLFGFYFGFGMPKTLGHYAASMEVGKRARISGLTFLIFALLSAILSLFVLESIILTSLMLSAIRLVGLLSFRTLGRKEELSREDLIEKTNNYPLKKTFVLYFFPWAIFCLVNYLTVPIISVTFNDYTDFLTSIPIVENVVIAVSAVASGILADRIGRKRLIMIGFVMLGIGFATLGLFVNSAPLISGYIYTISDGVAWGIFYVMFLLTLWGDIAKSWKVELLYALGALPFIFADFLRLSLQSSLNAFIDPTKNPTQIFSFASVFLFLAVIPLLYAPETLSDKIIENQELNNYVNKALKKVKKESLRNNKTPQKLSEANSQNYKVTEEDMSEHGKKYEEASKLAEKYY